MGLAEGCTLVRDVAKDTMLTFADVELPDGRLVDELWREQAAQLPPLSAAACRDAQA